VLRLLGGPTRSFHLGERYSTIDVDLPAMDRDDADGVEAAVLDAIAGDFVVRTHLCPPEDVSTFPLRRRPPEWAGVLRVVEIDGLDYTPCCGTHLARTGAIDSFRLLRIEKYKGMMRLYFVAGGRAWADYRKAAAALRDAAAAAGCSEDEVPAAMVAARARIRELELALKAAKSDIAVARAALLVRGLSPGTVVAETLDGCGYDEAEALARAVAETGHACAIAAGTEPRVACASPAGGPDLGRLIKPLLAGLGGKGGGGATFFQASFADADAARSFLDAARRALGGA